MNTAPATPLKAYSFIGKQIKYTKNIFDPNDPPTYQTGVVISVLHKVYPSTFDVIVRHDGTKYAIPYKIDELTLIEGDLND
jgi:hypothetical protein